MFSFGRPHDRSNLLDVPQVTKIDKDLTSKTVKSDLLLEERRIDAAAESSEQGSAMATRR
jgi:hypothetical protein